MRYVSRHTATCLATLSALSVCSARVRAQLSDTAVGPTAAHATVAFAYPSSSFTEPHSSSEQGLPRGGLDPRRRPYVGTGALVGAVAGAAYAFAAAKDGLFGYYGGFAGCLVTVPVGLFAGGVAGYGVSLVFVR
jgi:hypothetical protein